MDISHSRNGNQVILLVQLRDAAVPHEARDSGACLRSNRFESAMHEVQLLHGRLCTGSEAGFTKCSSPGRSRVPHTIAGLHATPEVGLQGLLGGNDELHLHPKS